MTIKEAGHELWVQYVEPPAKDPNVQAIGLNEKDNIIHIYTKKSIKGYPATYEGFEVRVTKIGKMVAN